MEPPGSSRASRAEESSKPGRGGVSAPGGFNAEALDRFCERGILAAVLGILTLGPILTGATKMWQTLVLIGLGALIAPLWITRVWLRKQYRFLFPPFAWMALVFVGYAVWRYFEADIEYPARMELLQIILFALLFFAVLDNLTRQESIQILLFALVGLAMLNAFYAIYQYLTDSQYVLWYDKPSGYKGRGSGTYICPNHLAGFLEMILPVALACTIAGRFKPLTKVFLGYATLAILAGIAVSVSRGGYISMGVSLIVFFLVLLWNRDFRIPALAALIILVTAGSFLGFRSYQSQKRFAQLEESNVRLFYWEPALAMWKANFWFGVGAGHYDWRYRAWKSWRMQERPMNAHSDYLNTLAEYGTTGGAIIGASLLVLGWGVFRSWKYVRRTNEIVTKPSNRAAILLGCSVGLVAILVHSAGDFNMHIPANAAIAVTLMAIIVSHWRFATERYWMNPGVFGRILLTVLIGGAGTYLGWQFSRVAPQYYVLRNYFQPMTLEQKMATLERAYAYDPMNGAVSFEAGELLRKQAFKGEEGYEDLLRRAIPWLEKSLALNKWNPFIHTNLGMCYDWLKEPEKASDHFDKALALDPKGYEVVALYGWHRLQLGDLEGAQKYLKESYGYYWDNNPIAKNYLEIVERRLAEKRAGR